MLQLQFTGFIVLSVSVIGEMRSKGPCYLYGLT